jgi:uncharacterized membrane protein
MTMWVTGLGASVIAYVLKLLGYVLPRSILDHPRATHITGLLPVALLSALVAVQAFTAPSGTLVLDARAAAIVGAVVALLLRAPFLVVVVVAAAVAAWLRALGLP